MSNTGKKPKLLLHICCAGCGAFIAGELEKEFELSLFFYNPNIFPETEHERRLEEARRVSEKLNLKIYTEVAEHEKWLKLIFGFENEKERGKRCEICIGERLDRTAARAALNGYEKFATTLSISPHKSIQMINEAGHKAMVKHGVEFLMRDFKKNDGFKKSICASKELGLYRQDYCGCEFSIR